jgi:hypothetical protein
VAASFAEKGLYTFDRLNVVTAATVVLLATPFSLLTNPALGCDAGMRLLRVDAAGGTMSLAFVVASAAASATSSRQKDLIPPREGEKVAQRGE